MADFIELEYFCQAAHTISSSLHTNKGAALTKNKISVKSGKVAEDFIGLDANPED